MTVGAQVMTDEGKGRRGYAQGITGAERGTGDMYRGREGMTGKVQRVMGRMKISKGTGNSKVSCAYFIRQECFTVEENKRPVGFNIKIEKK